jgi:NAD(P)-dependent dehydrogenase (short-subunit alcohol dehydrogenase family)
MLCTGGARSESKDGLEVHMQTNHLSHFLLALGLLPALQRGAQQAPQHSSSMSPAGADAPFRPRIVTVASAMHHFGYKFGPSDPLLKRSYSTTMAYGNSKLAQVITRY